MITPVILDMARCGTTMAAGVLERLGCPMTLGGDRGWLEDAAVAHAFRRHGEFEALCKTREGQRWGFKHPGSWRFTDRLCHIPEPAYFAIYKEPVSVAWNLHQEITPMYVQMTVCKMLTSMQGIVQSGLKPVYWLSYLDAVRNPLEFARRLSAICKLDASPEQVGAAAAWVRLEGQSNA